MCRNNAEKTRLRRERGSDPKRVWSTGDGETCLDCPEPRARVMTRKQAEPIGEFVNPGIAVTKVPPVLRPSLRNMFGDERGETWLATDW